MIFQTKHAKIFLIFILILIFIFAFNFSDSIRSITLNTLSPFLKIGNCFYGNIGQSYKIENNQTNLTDYESLKYENKKLREGLGLKPVGNFITASVIAKPPQIPLDSLFLDKGADDGIDNGDFVFAGERTLIGKIVKTSKNKSTVALNSFAGATTYGFVARTDEPLEIKGVGGGGLEAKTPIDFDIAVGDKIMTTRSFSFLVAIVGATEEDKSSGFKKILMSLPVDISRINIVFVEPAIQ